MSIKTGIRRLAVFIKVIAALIAVLFVALATQESSDRWPLALLGLGVGAFVWAIAWVLDGFAKE